MFKYRAIKKYKAKLLPKLSKRFGDKDHYTASEVRSTIYQGNFNPKFLPLGYILFLENNELLQIMEKEFPHVCLNQYKGDMVDYLTNKKYRGCLNSLQAV